MAKRKDLDSAEDIRENVSTTRRYNRVVSAFKGNPARGLLE